MRSDLILPLLLALALIAMVVYATTGAHDEEGGKLGGSPASCQVASRVGRLAELDEASGLASSVKNRGILWSHNDSADGMLYALGVEGTPSGRVRVAGASVIDWEAVTVGACARGSCVYIGDIGDNGKQRHTITVYRTPEPSPSDRMTDPVEVLEATYPDGPQDAESLFVVPSGLYLVTKGENGPLGVYRFPSDASNGVAKLEQVAQLSDGAVHKSARVTDAAASPNGEWVAMRTTERVLFYRTSALLTGSPGAPLTFDVRPLKEPQGEGLAWTDDRTLFLAGERTGGGTFARLTCALPPG